MQFEFSKVQDLTGTARREIDAFLDSQDKSHPFQFPNWLGTESAKAKEKAYCATLREKQTLRWFALCGMSYSCSRLVPSIHSLTVYRGPVCDDPDLLVQGLQKLTDHGQPKGVAYIDISPEWVEGDHTSLGAALATQGWEVLPGRRTSLRLDLSPGNEELFSSFRKATRYEIRRSQREGVEIRLAQNEQDLRAFQRIYRELAEKKKFPATESKLLLNILRWFVKEQDRGALLLAFRDGTLLGGTVVVRAATRSWYVFGATTKEERLSAGHLLQWHAIRWAKERGCIEYDFGGYREDSNTGPPLFKRGFCQSIVHFLPTYRYVVNPRLYATVGRVGRGRSSLASAAQRLLGRAH